jgi:hypothetical protein
MLHFDNKGRTFLDAFNVSEDDTNKVYEFLRFFDRVGNVSRTAERIWIDETVSDNVKAFALFSLGRLWENRRIRKITEGGEEDE